MLHKLSRLSLKIFLTVLISVILIISSCSKIEKGADDEKNKGEITPPPSAAEYHSKNKIREPQWSHDGKEILYLMGTEENDSVELWKVNIEDKTPKILSNNIAWPSRASWSLDDSAILYTKLVITDNKDLLVPELYLIDRKGLQEQVLVPASELGKVTYEDNLADPISVHACWSPNGNKIALQLGMAGIDAHSDQPRFLAIASSDGKELRQVDGQIFLGWKNSNEILSLKTHQNYNYGHSYRYDLFSTKTGEEKATKLLLGEGQITNLDRFSQSADYKTLVTGHWESFDMGNHFKQEGTKIILYNLEENTLMPIGLDEGYQKHPALDPTGKKVAFVANKEGSWNLYLWNDGKTEQLTTGTSQETYPTWSPDGEKLAYVSTKSGAEEIWILYLSSGERTQLTGEIAR